MKFVQASLIIRKEGPVKHVLACLSIKKESEGSFHHCGGPVKLMHASLRIRKGPEARFYYCCDPVRLMQDSLGVGKDVESSFHLKSLYCEAF